VQGKPKLSSAAISELFEGTVKVHVSAILKALPCTRAPKRSRLARRGIASTHAVGTPRFRRVDAALTALAGRAVATTSPTSTRRCRSPRSRHRLSRTRAPIRSHRSIGPGTGRPCRWCHGAVILCGVLWEQERGSTIAVWLAAILANQVWRGVLARLPTSAARGRRCAWRGGPIGQSARRSPTRCGAAAVAMFPASAPYQALFIVCQFRRDPRRIEPHAVSPAPSFYGFCPRRPRTAHCSRRALRGDRAHLFTALVLVVVLGFVITFGRQVNDMWPHRLAYALP
jgi:hypothetical protein